VQYPAHLRHLEVHSRILDIAEAREESPDSNHLPRIQLAEDADVLELLLQFMYPHPQPDLEHQPFERVLALAMAVHKYDVLTVTPKCEEILMYAYKPVYFVRD
jgi:hypothetical protein